MRKEDAQTVWSHASERISSYEDVYKKLHQAPELSKQEYATAEFVAAELRKMAPADKKEDFKVITGIGNTGVVAYLRNGPGKTVMLRAELDALPVREDTGLPYSSTTTIKNERDGTMQPVMHACGHDMHMTSLLCTAESMLANRHLWQGTLIMIFQPSEEDGAGAQSMVDDGLYDPKRFAVPKPDIILAGHLMPVKAGQVGIRPEVVNGAVQSVQVTVYGKGGHGARPQTTIDPVVIASSIVIKLQTIVSRETAPTDSVVITVGSIHAGTVENIISDHAVLKINIRALSTAGLKQTYEAVTRVVEGECHTFRCPKPPQILPIGGFPLLYNDPTLTQEITEVFSSYFKERCFVEENPSLGAEDLCNLVIDGSLCCFWNIGCIDHETYDRAMANGDLRVIAGNHSAQFAPVIQPTLNSSVEAFIMATSHVLDGKSAS